MHLFVLNRVFNVEASAAADSWLWAPSKITVGDAGLPFLDAAPGMISNLPLILAEAKPAMMF